MSNNSIVEHRGSYHFVALREEYIVICMNCTYKKQAKDGAKSQPKPSLHCKALILDILENWMNNKRGKGQDLAIYMTYPQWVKAMYGMFGRNVIIDSLDELVGEGLVIREPHKMYGKETYKYRLNYQEINRRIRSLPERDPNEEHPQLEAFTNKPQKSEDAFTNKPEAFTNKPDSHLLVNDDPSKSKRNIESDIDSSNIDITERKNDAPRQNPNVTEEQASHSSIHASPSSQKKSSSSSSQEKSEEVELTEEEQAIYDYGCQTIFKAKPPKKTPKLKGECAEIAKHVKTAKQFDSLLQFVRALPYIQGQVHLKNLVNELNGWLQSLEAKPPAPASSHTYKTSPTATPPMSKEERDAITERNLAKLRAAVAAKGIQL